MSLRRRLFLTLCLIVLVGFFGIARWINGELRMSYSQVVEETLVDYAHLIAAYVEINQFSQDTFQSLDNMFTKYKSQKINAKIFEFIKTNHTLEFYVTDTKGLVIFSTKKEEIGQDFSNWNDVYRTLRGEYGARSTRTDPNDSRTSVYFVAAPIIIDSKIAGVATVYKSESSILLFLDRALKKMFRGGLFSVIALALIGGLILVWITFPLERLRKYATNVAEGNRNILPKSNVKEIKQLTDAFENMRISLEGKKTVEKYTQMLTHELKSPLTVIKGAAELCLEEIGPEQSKIFLNNIIDESNRSHLLLEQLLKIAALESKHHLEQTELIDPALLLYEVTDALMSLWKSKNIAIKIDSTTKMTIDGDRLLLFQSFRNIIQNAIEFSYPNSEIHIQITGAHTYLQVEISDEGIGIPDFAKDRIFEKFYSLERPDTKRKSSGLGLNFVKEVIDLHHGKILLQRPQMEKNGTSIIVQLPTIKT